MNKAEDVKKAEADMRLSFFENAPPPVRKNLDENALKKMAGVAFEVLDSNKNVDIKLSGNEFTGNNLSHSGKSTKGGGLSA